METKHGKTVRINRKKSLYTAKRTIESGIVPHFYVTCTLFGFCTNVPGCFEQKPRHFGDTELSCKHETVFR